jgi:carbon monoxide dehydrogenase subunit G
MLKIDSKTGQVNGSQEAVYRYISDFRNFSHMLPAERLRNIEITGDTLRFAIDGLGNIGLKITEKTPFSQLVITRTEDSSADFTFWFNIKPIAENRSQVFINLHANLNMFLEMMAQGPLQQFVDMIVDKLAAMQFGDKIT